MRVLVAGDCGYSGAVLVPLFRGAGHEVEGLDLELYEGCDLGPAQPDATAQGYVDMRNVTGAQLTAYGASTRLRLDIVVNNLTAVALTTGQVRLESDGTAWRPLIHIEDISRAFLAMLEAPRELVHDEAFNVGRAEDNVQIREIAGQVRDTVPGSEVTFAANAGPDLRNYRVDFAKLNDTFPALSLRWTVRDGVAELLAAYTKYSLTYEDFTGSRFVRLRKIKELMAVGTIDDTLKRPAAD